MKGEIAAVEVKNVGHDEISVQAGGDSPNRDPVVLAPGEERTMSLRWVGSVLRLEIAGVDRRTGQR